MITVNKFARLLHTRLTQDKILNPSNYVTAPRNYKKALQEISTLVLAHESVTELKKQISALAYFNFRNNSDKFVKSALALKKELKEEEEDTIVGEEG